MSKQTDEHDVDKPTINISEISDIDEQKNFCNEALSTLFDHEQQLKTRFVNAQTIYDILESDVELKADLAEFIGYQYGLIQESMKTLEMSVLSLQKVIDGGLDSIDYKSRGMYISLWFSLAIEKIETLNDSCDELSKLESEMVERIMSDETEESVILRGSFH